MKRRDFVKAGICSLLPVSYGWCVEPARPLFSFGVASDIQYADADTAIGRDYRASIGKLQQCRKFWDAERLKFVIQLGDLADRGGLPTLEKIAGLYELTKGTKHSVLGNHDFVGPRDEVIRTLKMPAAYYDFVVHGWRFIVMDGMNVSTRGGWSEDNPHAVEGRAILARLTEEKAPNAKNWNGAAGAEQRDWLRSRLSMAEQKKERAIVFSHFPVLPASCRPMTLLWDYREVVEILEANHCVAAYINGHDHDGGHGEQNGIPYVTLPAVVEHAAEKSCFIVDVHPDHLVMRSLGGERRVLSIQHG